MDGIDDKRGGMEYIKKYRYVLLVFLLGIVMMVLPDGNKKTEETAVPKEPVKQLTLQESLAEILGKIEGAGKTEVLLTESTGERTYYQTNEDRSTGEVSDQIRKETVLISQSGRGEDGLVLRKDPPVYQGAVILCQGAENAKVKLAIVEAVSRATGLSSDKISVLKMK